MNFNKVLIAGNLTRDPVMRYSNSGSPVCDFGMAVNRKFRRGDGEMSEDTCFVDVVVWARQAETCNQYLKKGAGVFVEGRLQFEQWQAQDGQKRNKLKVVGERVQFMPRGGGRAPDDVQNYGSSYNDGPPMSEPSMSEPMEEFDSDVPF